MPKPSAPSRFRSSSSPSSSRNTDARQRETNFDDINDLSDFDVSDVSTVQMTAEELAKMKQQQRQTSMNAAAAAKAATTAAMMGQIQLDPREINQMRERANSAHAPKTVVPPEPQEQFVDSSVQEIDMPFPELRPVKHSYGSKGVSTNAASTSTRNRNPNTASRFSAQESTASAPLNTPAAFAAPTSNAVAATPAAPAATAAAPAAAPAIPSALERVMLAKPTSFGTSHSTTAATTAAMAPAPAPETTNAGVGTGNNFFDQAQQPTFAPNSLESRVAQAHNAIFGDGLSKRTNTPKAERKQVREVQADEIARRTAEIWGKTTQAAPAAPDTQTAASSIVSQNTATATATTAFETSTGASSNPLANSAYSATSAPVSTAAPLPMSPAAAAAAAVEQATGALEGTPLRNPQAPSTLINGLAFDFNQSNDAISRGIANARQQQQQQQQQNNQPASSASGAQSTMSYTQRAFAALNRLNENSTRISGVSSALNNRVIDQEPTTNTLITSSPTPAQPAMNNVARSAAATLANLNDHHTTTILSDNRGRLVSDDLGRFTHESDLIKAANNTAAAFKSAAASPDNRKPNTNTVIARSPAPAVQQTSTPSSISNLIRTELSASNTHIMRADNHSSNVAGRGLGPTVDILSLSEPLDLPRPTLTPATAGVASTAGTASASAMGAAEAMSAAVAKGATSAADAVTGNTGNTVRDTSTTNAALSVLDELSASAESDLARKEGSASQSKLFTAGLTGASVITSNHDPDLQKPDTLSTGLSAVSPSGAANATGTANNESGMTANQRQALDSIMTAAQSLKDEIKEVSQTLHIGNLIVPATLNAQNGNTGHNDAAQAAATTADKASTATGSTAAEVKDPFKVLLQESDRQPLAGSHAAEHNTTTPNLTPATAQAASQKTEHKKTLFTMVPDEEPAQVVDINTLTDPLVKPKTRLSAAKLDKIVLTPPFGNQQNSEESTTLEPPNWTNPLSLRPEDANPLARPQHRDPGFTLSEEEDELPSLEPAPATAPVATPDAAPTATQTATVMPPAPPAPTAPVAPVAPMSTAPAASTVTPAANSIAAPELAPAAVAQPAATATAASVAVTAPVATATPAVAPAIATTAADSTVTAESAEDDSSDDLDDEWYDEEVEDDSANQLTPAQLMMHEYMSRCHDNLGSCTYFTSRAISNDVASRFDLGYDPFYRTLPQNQMMQELSAYQIQQLNNLETWQAAIIPLSIDSFVAYKIATVNATGMAMPASWDLEERRYIGTMQCFNLEAINQATLRHTPVFITGSEIDALTLESLNLPALALGHASNLGSLWRYLQNFMLNLRENSGAQLSVSSDHLGLSCYVALPNGALWDEAQRQLKRCMRELNITCHVVDLHSPFSSINLCLLQNRTLLLNKLYHLNEISDVRLQEAVVQSEPLAAHSLVLSLESLAKLQLSPLLYTLASPAAAVSRLVQACLVENPRNSIIYAGSKMQWQMLCALLSFNPNEAAGTDQAANAAAATAAAASAGASVSTLGVSTPSYRTKFLEMPLSLSTSDIEQTLHHGLTMARLNGMEKFTLMVDTFALEQSLCAQLSARIAHLCVEFNIAAIVWCSLEQKHLFEGNSLQTIEMEQGQENEIIFKTLDSSCRPLSFSTVQG